MSTAITNFLADIFSLRDALKDVARAGVVVVMLRVGAFITGTAWAGREEFYWLLAVLGVALLVVMARAAVEPQRRFRLSASLALVQKVNDTTTVILCVAKVRNVGLPSIAESFTLHLTIPGRAETIAVHGEPLAPGSEVRLGGGAPLQSSMVSLLPVVATVPVPSGGQRSGLVLFVVRGVEHAAVLQDGVTAELSCEDVQGRVYRVACPARPLQLVPLPVGPVVVPNDPAGTAGEPSGDAVSAAR